MKIICKNLEKKDDIYFYEQTPNECPFCHRNISPIINPGYYHDLTLEIICQCPHQNCNKIFIAYYEQTNKDEVSSKNMKFTYLNTSIGKFNEISFSKEIKEISSLFVDIYNEASKAEELGLKHICGIGYRKAFEFLLKDYLIFKLPNNTEGIKETFLAKCIDSYVDNQKIKDMSKRAVWLGNDESHYSRKWENKDIIDLKNLIEVTTHWISMEILTDKYKNEIN